MTKDTKRPPGVGVRGRGRSQGRERRGRRVGRPSGHGSAVPAEPPLTPRPREGKLSGLPCSQNSCHGGDSWGWGHCCSLGLWATWTQKAKGWCRGPASHTGATGQSQPEATSPVCPGAVGARCLRGFRLEGAEWWAQHPACRLWAALRPLWGGGVVCTPSTLPLCSTS